MNFDKIYEILQQSFHPAFYRDYEAQKAIIENPLYKIKTADADKETIGFISYWDLGDFIYIEHFAVSPSQRGKGTGGRLLSELLKTDKTVVLEVEPPKTDTDKRRIKFYEGYGLCFNGFDYLQPPYREGFADEKLFIMSSRPLNYGEFISVVSAIYKNVYKKDIKNYKLYNL